MKTKKIKTNSGFAALMSSIIISVILLLVATNLSLTGFYARSNILDAEFKERSSALAEACADVAFIKLANDPDYTWAETIPVLGSDVCTIQTINPALDPITIQTKAIFQNATTDLQIKIDKDDLSVISWEEI